MVTTGRSPGTLDPQAAVVLAEIATLAEPDMTTVSPQEARQVRARRPSLGQTPIHALDTVEIAGVTCFVYRAHPHEAPALLWFHGGGWMLGGQATHDEVYRALAVGTGCHVIAPEYALAPEFPFPAAVDEATEIVAMLWESAPVAGVSKGRLAIGGDSAGANLAIVAALSEPHPSHRALALAYPVTDARCVTPSYALDHAQSYLQPEQMRWFVEHYLSSGGDKDDWRISPVLARDSDLVGLPPTHLVVASHDPLRDEGEEFARRLLVLGHDTEFARAEGLPHGFLGFASRAAAAQGPPRRPVCVHPPTTRSRMTNVSRIICSGYVDRVAWVAGNDAGSWSVVGGFPGIVGSRRRPVVAGRNCAEPKEKPCTSSISSS